MVNTFWIARNSGLDGTYNISTEKMNHLHHSILSGKHHNDPDWKCYVCPEWVDHQNILYGILGTELREGEQVKFKLSVIKGAEGKENA